MKKKKSVVKKKVTGKAVAVREKTSVKLLPEPKTMLEVISRAAFDPSIDAEKVKTLVELARQVRADDAKVAYINAMKAMKPELPVIEKNGRIVVKAKTETGKRDGEVTQDTPYPKWEDIDMAITPILGQFGFVLTFTSDAGGADGRVPITGILSHEAGHSERATMLLPLDTSGSKNNVQAAGSTSSYGKRYTAGMLLNLRFKGQDDDGQAGGWEAKNQTGTVSETQADQLLYMLNRDNMSVPKFCTFFKIENVLQLPAKRYEEAIVSINMRSKELAKPKTGAPT